MGRLAATTFPIVAPFAYSPRNLTPGYGTKLPTAKDAAPSAVAEAGEHDCRPRCCKLLAHANTDRAVAGGARGEAIIRAAILSVLARRNLRSCNSDHPPDFGT